MTILNEMNKQVEHLRLGRNGFTPSPQLLLCDIDFAFCKAKIQGISSSERIFSRLAVTSLCRASLWKSTNIIADGVSQENWRKIEATPSEPPSISRHRSINSVTK